MGQPLIADSGLLQMKPLEVFQLAHGFQSFIRNLGLGKIQPNQIGDRFQTIQRRIAYLVWSKLEIDLFFSFTSSETICQLVRWGSVQGNLAVSQDKVAK